MYPGRPATGQGEGPGQPLALAVRHSLVTGPSRVQRNDFLRRTPSFLLCLLTLRPDPPSSIKYHRKTQGPTTRSSPTVLPPALSPELKHSEGNL